LAQALIAQARARQLPAARLRFSYDGYGAKVSTLQALRGSSGWLALSVLTIEALGMAEDHLLLAATNAAGEPLHDEDAEKLLRLPAELLPTQANDTREPGALAQALQAQQDKRIREVNQRNLGYFDAEVQKLDAWADDLKSGLENEVKELDREIKDVRRTAAVAATLEEKLHWQKRQRELEDKRNQLRRRIFDRQDEIDGQRNRLIEELEAGLSKQVRSAQVFTVEWTLD
jgi:peptidoglycan hydrolase CwlO-like protein